MSFLHDLWFWGRILHMYVKPFGSLIAYEVYMKDFSKFHFFLPFLSSWWSSIHLLQLKIQMWRIPPCYTSKAASWHVHWRYELHLFPFLSKIWLKVSKTCDILCFLLYCQFLRLLNYGKGGFFTFEFSTPEGGLRTIRKTEMEENNEWNFEKSFVCTS